MKIKIVFSFLICVSYLHVVAQQQVMDTSARKLQSQVSLNSNLTYSIVSSQNHTFGYDIYSNKKILIKQLTIPGLNGRDGFKTKIDAEKIAQLVVDKIRNGKMPPSVTIEEMKNLNILPK